MYDFSAWHARLWLGVPVRLAFGDVLQVATRRTDWLEDIHEGKWHDLNLWLFLPVHVLSLIVWLTGTVVAYSRDTRFLGG